MDEYDFRDVIITTLFVTGIVVICGFLYKASAEYQQYTHKENMACIEKADTHKQARKCT